MEFTFLFVVFPKICFSTSTFQDFCSDFSVEGFYKGARSIKGFWKFYELLCPRKPFNSGC